MFSVHRIGRGPPEPGGQTGRCGREKNPGLMSAITPENGVIEQNPVHTGWTEGD